MGTRIKIIAFMLGLLFFSAVFRCVRQNNLRPFYAVLWLGLAGFLLSIAALEPVYKWMATSVIGILDARHVIYIAMIGFLLVYSLYLTTMVSRMSNQIRHLISAVAMLEGREPHPVEVAASPVAKGNPR
jgi:hypothetical protein